jgi:hypothetical protein
MRLQFEPESKSTVSSEHVSQTDNVTWAIIRQLFRSVDAPVHVL